MTENLDSWSNVLTGIGGARDPIRSARITSFRGIDRQTLTNIYRSDGMGRRVVDLIVDDAIREWIEGGEELLAELARVKAKQEITDAAKWARLYGGAVIVALVDDGQDFDAPVNMGAVRQVKQLRVYDRHRVSWTTADLERDAMQTHFGEPNFYTVQPLDGTPYRVHRSRLWVFDGMPLPITERQRNEGWGDSALGPVYESLSNYSQVMGASANIVRDFIQVVLGVRGLQDMFIRGEEKMIAARANSIDLTRSVANTIFIDAEGETYEKRASSVAGLADLWDRFALHISGVTGIPATKLMGRSPNGLNATGESDIRQWYDVVQAYRRDEIEPALQWLVGLIDAQSEWTDRPESMDWQWPPLHQPTEAEWADVKLKTAQADAIYIDRGAAEPEYLYHLRYGQGEFRPDAQYTQQGLEEFLAAQIGTRDLG